MRVRGDAVSRQLRLLALLEARPEGLEPDEAAEELGAPRRTVYRDLQVLEGVGVPLTSARDGRRARWQILKGFRHRLQLSLSWSELLALMTARRAVAGLGGTVFHDGVVSALEKIRVTLPRELAERFRVAEHLVSAAEGGRDYQGRGEIVSRLIDAIAGRWTIEARYRSRRTKGRHLVAERRLDPLHLRVAEEGVYLLARCHPGGELKLFLVDRFDDVRLTTVQFIPPTTEPPEKVLQTAFGMWAGRPRHVRFTVAPELADLLMERKVHPSQLAQRRSDGSLEVQLEVAIGPPLVAYLAGLGAGVGEIEPRELRTAVMDVHREALMGAEGRASSFDTGRR